MTDNGKVLIKNTLTGLYGEVPTYIFEHPVYGQYMELDTREDPECIDCGKNAEADAKAEVIDNEAPAESKKAKDNK
jgi:hypothetical protein